jgi:hypothetical protein
MSPSEIWGIQEIAPGALGAGEGQRPHGDETMTQEANLYLLQTEFSSDLSSADMLLAGLGTYDATDVMLACDAQDSDVVYTEQDWEKGKTLYFFPDHSLIEVQGSDVRTDTYSDDQ